MRGSRTASLSHTTSFLQQHSRLEPSLLSVPRLPLLTSSSRRLPALSSTVTLDLFAAPGRSFRIWRGLLSPDCCDWGVDIIAVTCFPHSSPLVLINHPIAPAIFRQHHHSALFHPHPPQPVAHGGPSHQRPPFSSDAISTAHHGRTSTPRYPPGATTPARVTRRGHDVTKPESRTEQSPHGGYEAP